MNQLPLEDVLVFAQVRSSHAASVIAVGKTAFHQFSAPAKQAPAVVALDASAVGIHRLLLASNLQRTRYYFANRARVNEPEYTRGRDEISGRFYEGAAAGTVMIGEAPRVDSFDQQFDWSDAVIHVPFDSPDIMRILSQLDADPARLARIRRNNITNAAMRHDWLYRVRTVFDTFQLPHTPAMFERQQRLQAIAGLPEPSWPSERAVMAPVS